MNKKLLINSGISTGSPINDALQNFVSVYSCPIDYETTPVEHFPTYSTETYQMSNIVSGKAFIDDKNAKNVILTKIKDFVTVTEFEILCNTNYRSDLKQIIKYYEIIGKLIQAKVFNDINADKL
jgi:hypothetical protein